MLIIKFESIRMKDDENFMFSIQIQVILSIRVLNMVIKFLNQKLLKNLEISHDEI